MRFQCRCPLILLSKDMCSNSNAIAQIVAECTFLPFVFIGHCLYTFIAIVLAKYVNILYLLDPQLLACTPIKLDNLINLTHAWASFVAVAMLTVSHSHRCYEMWIQYSVYVDKEFFFLWSWKTALRSPRIVTLTKTQHIHCTQFAEEFLRYTPRLLALTMEFVGIWTG